MTHHQATTDDGQQLTKRDEARIRELRHMADELEKTNLLYGSAADGLAPVIEEEGARLDAYGFDAKMTAVQKEVVRDAVRALADDIATFGSLEDEVDEDDAAEVELLERERDEPQE